MRAFKRLYFYLVRNNHRRVTVARVLALCYILLFQCSNSKTCLMCVNRMPYVADGDIYRLHCDTRNITIYQHMYHGRFTIITATRMSVVSCLVVGALTLTNTVAAVKQSSKEGAPLIILLGNQFIWKLPSNTNHFLLFKSLFLLWMLANNCWKFWHP